MPDEIDNLRHGLEEFTREVDEEHYLTAAGLKEQADFSRIFEKHNQLFTHDTIDKVQKRLKAASGDAVDDGFYSANYLRAWMFEAQIRDRLINDYGEGWFGKKEAGAQLQKWWSLGQKYCVEEILRELGYNGLDPDPLLKEIQRNLN